MGSKKPASVPVELFLAAIKGGFRLNHGNGVWVNIDDSNSKAEREGIAIQRMRGYRLRSPFCGGVGAK